MSRRTFVPLYREFGEHATRLSDPAYKLYVTLLIYADYQTGCWCGSVVELGELVGKSPATVRRLLAELEGHYIKTDGRGAMVVTIHRYQSGRDAANTAVSHRRHHAINRVRIDTTEPTPSVVSKWVSEGLKRLSKPVDNSPNSEI